MSRPRFRPLKTYRFLNPELRSTDPYPDPALLRSERHNEIRPESSLLRNAPPNIPEVVETIEDNNQPLDIAADDGYSIVSNVDTELQVSGPKFSDLLLSNIILGCYSCGKRDITGSTSR